MSNFEADLERGLVAEDLVLDKIKIKYPCAVKIEGHHSPYDIWIPEIHKSVEVKYDPMSNSTGNYVVEVWFNKPSALTVTTADYWVFYDDIDLVYVEPDKIKNYILIHNLPIKEFIGPGDYLPKKVYLIKKEILKSL